MALTADKISHAAADIYRSTADENFTHLLMRRVEDLLSAHSSAYVWADRQSSNLIQTNVNEEVQALYNEALYAGDVWIERSYRLPAGVAVSGMQLAGLDEFGPDYLNEILRRSDCVDALCFKIAQDTFTGSFFSLYRGASMGVFSEAEIDMLQPLAFHIQNAVELHRDVTRLQAANSVAGHVQVQYDSVAVVVDEDGRLLWSNAGAEKMFDTGHCIVSKGGELRIGQSPWTLNLKRNLDHASNSGGSSAPIRGEEGEIVGNVRIQRMEEAAEAIIGENLFRNSVSVAFLLTFHLFGPPARDCIRFLCEAYGLTSREAEISYLIASGKTSEEICVDASITSETLRSHVRNSMSKMGVNSRLEIVRLVNSIY